MMGVGDVYTFPRGTEFQYLAEGAANVVFRISLPVSTPPPSVLDEYGDGEPIPSDEELDFRESPAHRCLLRLRKDLPTTVPVKDSQDAFRSFIYPLFHADQLVQQSLVQFQGVQTMETLNRELEIMEHPLSSGIFAQGRRPRPPKRVGTYLADDKYGLLITDMSPGIDEILVEFKPKWLIQSNSAPKTSRRCRQCAQVARANAENRGEEARKVYCPLDLVSRDFETLKQVAATLLDLSLGHPRVIQLAAWLRRNKLLPRLRDYQQKFDRKGPLEADVDDVKFRCAMTLRDCTVYIRFPQDTKAPAIEARLGDLDLKSKAKKDYWQSRETALIEEGWYEGLEKDGERQPIVCALNRNAVNETKEIV